MKPVTSMTRVSVSLGGEPLTQAEAAALGAVRVRQRLQLPAMCDLTFEEPAAPLAEKLLRSAGQELQVRVADEALSLLDGEVTAVEVVCGPSGGRRIHLRGYDLLHRLRKRRPTRAHVQVTVPDLARELVAGDGLSVDAVETGPLWHQRIQAGESDLELLTRIAERSGLYFQLREGTLRLFPRGGDGGAARDLELGDSLLEARVELNADPSCRTVEARGWDPWHAEFHRARAREPRGGPGVAVHPPCMGGDGERFQVNETVQDRDQAASLAQADLDRRAGGEVGFWGIAQGDVHLRPGTAVEVAGLPPGLSGRYVLGAVLHTIDQHKGFVSELSTVLPPPLEPLAGVQMIPGVVSAVADPDDLGRVRVTLPACGDVETPWLEVLSVAAGEDKGLTAIPDTGDHVLLLASMDDPAQAVVLGGLYGTGGPPDSGVRGSGVRCFTFRTPGGRTVRLDDDGELLRLESRDGGYLELSGKKAVLHAGVPIEIEAPGHAVVIRGARIDFERA